MTNNSRNRDKHTAQTPAPQALSAQAPATKAIAVQDQSSDNKSPKITAKGHGHLAEKILSIAFAEGIKVRQDQALTDLLDAFDVESPIPLEALHAVSLILERVSQEDRKLKEKSILEDKDWIIPPKSHKVKNS